MGNIKICKNYNKKGSLNGIKGKNTVVERLTLNILEIWYIFSSHAIDCC